MPSVGVQNLEENIELISDRPLETMLKEFKQLKEEYPDRILIASIMEEYNKAAREELIASTRALTHREVKRLYLNVYLNQPGLRNEG
ncbi:Aldolase-type TIM barrel [Sesbania bispinosa]|nr:Aldolase-type TIM barrel [Sesbania bispinosa]